MITPSKSSTLWSPSSRARVAELLALGEDVGVGDQRLDTHLLHLFRGDELEVGIDDREERGGLYRLFPDRQFPAASRAVAVQAFKCYRHAAP